jgi:hypothetical protein
VAADKRMIVRCFRDDFSGFVHDVSHVTPPIQRAVRPLCGRQKGKQHVGEVADQTDTNAGRDCSDDGRLFRINFHAPSLAAVERQGLIWIMPFLASLERTFPTLHQRHGPTI